MLLINLQERLDTMHKFSCILKTTKADGKYFYTTCKRITLLLVKDMKLNKYRFVWLEKDRIMNSSFKTVPEALDYLDMQFDEWEDITGEE